jgi:hypothetical protein
MKMECELLNQRGISKYRSALFGFVHLIFNYNMIWNSLLYTFSLFGILIFYNIYLYPSAFCTLNSTILYNVIKKSGT